MTLVVPDDTGRAAHDSQRALPAAVSIPLYDHLRGRLGTGVVLDVGCGSGIVSAELGSRVIMTDVVDWRSVVDPPFVRADAAALPFAARIASGVHLARVLHHVPDWRAVLREVTRVLAVDGGLCLSLGDKPVDDRLRELISAAADLAIARGLREAPVTGPDQATATGYLAELGWSRTEPVEFGAAIQTTPRAVVSAALGNPFRWLPDQDLTGIPALVDEVLAGSDPDTRIMRDRTVRYVTYRTGG